jgi:hypothetical protein
MPVVGHDPQLQRCFLRHLALEKSLDDISIGRRFDELPATWAVKAELLPLLDQELVITTSPHPLLPPLVSDIHVRRLG